MEEKINENGLMKILNSIYSQTMTGLPGTDSAKELAEEYLKEGGSLEEKIDSLIRMQNIKCAASGFITNLGGAITLPIAIPANLSSVLYMQLRMIAAIAYMCGHDPKSDRVKTLAFVCLCGNEAKDILKDAMAIPLGKELAKAAIKKIPNEIIKRINKAVGTRLLTKFGSKGLINLGKAIPAIGGFIGGGMDLFATNIIGDKAKEMFM